MNIKEELLEMMEEIDRCAKQNSQEYFLAYGSLIGAVRNKGMIPWDDEIDITVKQENYNQFISLLKMNLSEKFEVLTKDSDDYELYFARVKLKNVNHHSCHIDIFPLVGVPENDKSIYKFVRNSVLLNKLFYIKRMDIRELYSNRPKRKIQAYIVRALTFFIPLVCIENKLSGLANQYDSKSSDYLYTFGGSYWLREVYKGEWYESKLSVPFEHLSLYIPNGYDEILRQVYGDYMKPKEQDYLS